MQLAFIDHYDSFSFNVLDWITRAASKHRNLELKISHIYCDDERGLTKLQNNPIPTVISPGPGKSSDYPGTIRLLHSLRLSTPILGVCLGHQMIGQIFGGTVARAKSPWHGTRQTTAVTRENWFTAGLPEKFSAISYNSLICELSDSRGPLQIAGVNSDLEPMIFTHLTAPIASVQFHPESFGSDPLDILALNFLSRAL